jgi:hypothetical protein
MVDLPADDAALIAFVQKWQAGQGEPARRMGV